MLPGKMPISFAWLRKLNPSIFFKKKEFTFLRRIIKFINKISNIISEPGYLDYT